MNLYYSKYHIFKDPDMENAACNSFLPVWMASTTEKRIVQNGSNEMLYVKGLCKQQSSTNVGHHNILLSFDFI